MSDFTSLLSSPFDDSNQELFVPVSENINMDLIPEGIIGGKIPVTDHTLVISEAGSYTFDLTSFEANVDFKIVDQNGKQLKKNNCKAR